ncbi:MAG TPA: efflux RND transporter periplasmic adaptor subunit [Ardenticatenaceae bacterium]
MRRIVLIVGVVAIVAALVYVAVVRGRPAQAQAEGEQVSVHTGTIAATVRATGNVEANRQLALSFRAAGRVAEVLVEAGEQVTEGQPLARLETTDAQFALEQAEAALAAQQAQLRQLESPPRESEVRAAEAVLESARAALDRLPEEAADAELAAAEAQVAQAEASLERLEAGTDPNQLDAARAGVQQTEVALEQARASLEAAELRAPFAGTVAAIGAQEGELTSNAQPMITLVDLSSFGITGEVDEVDIGQLEVGQPATVVVDSLPDAPLAGRIASIATVPSVAQGVVTYPVEVELEAAPPSLRVGMSANVDILTEERAGVLLVPNRAIRIDRDTGELYVERMVGEAAERAEITIGLRDETNSEVLEGLQDGDVVLIRNEE